MQVTSICGGINRLKSVLHGPAMTAAISSSLWPQPALCCQILIVNHSSGLLDTLSTAKTEACKLVTEDHPMYLHIYSNRQFCHSCVFCWEMGFCAKRNPNDGSLLFVLAHKLGRVKWVFFMVCFSFQATPNNILGHFRRYGRTCRTLWHGISCRLRWILRIGRFLYGHNVLHTQWYYPNKLFPCSFTRFGNMIKIAPLWTYADKLDFHTTTCLQLPHGPLICFRARLLEYRHVGLSIHSPNS